MNIEQFTLISIGMISLAFAFITGFVCGAAMASPKPKRQL